MRNVQQSDLPATDITLSQADPADVAEQSRAVEVESGLDEYPWVRRDEVLLIDGHRFVI
ncbi:putative protein OS=Tsukamurella paurometabola (strain ATCC 8368 / DSM / CCUG 35730 /CIP 100753 / JCM 10117 / KCTC 9821 / NBRC 16120 / NCIMB 702349/ NCTC 13040) OX=521096 GN=Tpau_4158 PE=4 SV=1 [Tsukamurella paurometabola]|uniref:Uncharacterized protein n=1 Tax=Tsukamurella paurometabola (strain ATCC 8368 / DSM 20162 / CCUG 35730 / CIP 100753 / JCM 10117 / KCTC 9821 / NBRC 16120 / NCIMB 702349 / NCTC 13040) TaxID=521096 RepID=D5UP18_TSUPD|nr:hypothetical protein [Tsukamurella paurometabola]ADG80727.1 hypothetical protein Tpau_4158 [Tsukamurella paurometabola DSM 20162]SUP40728.1 Uncharacterised protein [Tsukamurella paurometabola]